MADDVTNPNPTSEAPAVDAAAPDASAPVEKVDTSGFFKEPEADAPAGEQKQAEEAATGAPETYELTMPEGVTLDADALAIAEPIFRDLNLDNAQASKLAAAYPQIAEKLIERITPDIRKAGEQAVVSAILSENRDWEQQSRAAYANEGEFSAAKASAARFIDTYGGEALREALNARGAGNHPAILAAFAKAGAELGEDNQASGQKTDAKPKTLGEQYYGASA